MGTDRNMKMDYTLPDPTRPRDFVVIGYVHTHPTHSESFATGHGMSPQDYYALLGRHDQQVAMISFGENSRLLAMKTSVTPNGLDPETVKARVNDVKKDFLHLTYDLPGTMKAVVDFNRNVCLEFGLTMYMATKETKDQFNRVNVAG